MRRLTKNPASRWQSGWEVEPAEGTAWNHITAAPFFTPRVDPGFTVEPDDRTFAFGSCFARDVESALSRLGFTVDSLTDVCRHLQAGPRFPQGYLNKYNPESICQEQLVWGLQPNSEFPPEALQELPDGLWRDVQADPVFGAGDFDRTLDLHRRLSEVMRRAVTAASSSSPSGWLRSSTTTGPACIPTSRRT